MATRREILRAFACAPFAAAGLAAAAAAQQEEAERSHGFACALGEDADAGLCPAPRREGEHLALALHGTPQVAAQDLARVAGAAQCVWIELPDREQPLDDGDPLAERLRAAASIALVEGSVLEWLVALWPAHGGRTLRLALGQCAFAGGRLIGRGSTAFLLAGSGVARGPSAAEPGESRMRLENPRRSGEPLLATGLRLCGDFVVDTHARANGSALRLCSTLVDGHRDLGVLLGAHSALCCDLESKSWRALGESPLVAVDVGGSRRLQAAIEGARISVLAGGDGWDAVGRRWSSSGAPAEFGAAHSEVVAGNGLAFESLCAPPLEARNWRDERARVALRRGVDSAAFAGPAEVAARGQRMVLDVELERGRWGELGA